MKDVISRLRYEDGKVYWTKVNSNAIKVGQEAGYVSTDRAGDRRKIRVGNKQMYTSRVIYTMFKGAIPDNIKVDHIDGNTMNNRIDNLRLLDNALNVRNSKVKSGKLMRGVRKRGNRYNAYIKVNGKQKTLGMFNCETAAHLAYLKATNEYYPGILTCE